MGYFGVLVCINAHIKHLICTFVVAESYLVALCEGDRQEEASLLLETIDIKKVSSKENMERIFKALGRLSLESHAKQFILELKTDGNLFYYSVSLNMH